MKKKAKKSTKKSTTTPKKVTQKSSKAKPAKKPVASSVSAPKPKKKAIKPQPNLSHPTVKTRIRAPFDRVRIKVFGVGGGGGNAISRMRRNSDIRGIDFIAINTDSQDLEKTDARKKVHIGRNLTRGLGTGMDPVLGQQAAEENRAEIVDSIKGSDLVFITAGMGGGTGSGASPIVAEAAREHGALTIAIVTRPFSFEGAQRAQVAEEAISRLKDKVDALIVVPNDKIFDVIQKETPILKAFERIDDVLKDAIQGITELISTTGMINVDFADINAVMREAGSALVGVGHAGGQNRAAAAAALALNSPLLEFSIDGAKGILFGISGGRDVRMSEINEIAKHITANIDPSAKVIFGAYHDRRIKKGHIKVTLIATGFEASSSGGTNPVGERLISSLFNTPEEEIEENIIDLTTEKSSRELFSSEAEKEAKVSEPVSTRKERKHHKEELRLDDDTEEKVKDNIWDIPAFLRKKKKNQNEEEE